MDFNINTCSIADFVTENQVNFNAITNMIRNQLD